MLRVLLTGGGGQLGMEIVRLLESHDHYIDALVTNSSTLDVTKRDAVLQAVASFRPELIINCAGMTNVDLCEDDVDGAYATNAMSIRYLVEAADRYGGRITTVSTDYVFDGRASVPYREWDPTNPQSVYGASKLAGERELRTSDLCIRTSWVVGRFGHNMAKTVLRLSKEMERLSFVDDQIGSPTVASDLAAMVVDLGLTQRSGLYHVTGGGSGSWCEFAREVLHSSGQDPTRILPISTSDLQPPRKATRPAYSVLDNLALRIDGHEPMPEWRSSVGTLVRELVDG